MNKLATIVPVLGIGALNSGLTLIDDNASNVKSLSTGVVVVPVGLFVLHIRKLQNCALREYYHWLHSLL